MRRTNLVRLAALALAATAVLAPAPALATGVACEEATCTHAAYIEGVDAGHYETIQAAINDATEGQTIMVKAGEHAEHLIINGDKNLTIKGEDGAVIKPTTLVQTGSGMAIVYVNGGSGITVRNLTIDGSAAGENTSDWFLGNWFHGIFIDGGADDVTVENCKVLNITRANPDRCNGISIIHNGTVNITGTRIENFGLNGINPGTCANYDAAQVNLTRCTIVGSGEASTMVQNGVVTKQNMTIRDCTFQNIEWRDDDVYNVSMGGVVSAYAVTTTVADVKPTVTLSGVTCKNTPGCLYADRGAFVVKSGTYPGGVVANGTGTIQIDGGTFTSIEGTATDANGNEVPHVSGVLEPQSTEAKIKVTSDAFEGVATFDRSVASLVEPKEFFEALNPTTGCYTYHRLKGAAVQAAGPDGTVTAVTPTDGELAVTLVFDNGVDPNEVYAVRAGSDFALPTPTRTGYLFSGWDDGTETHPAGGSVTITEDTTLTAVWTPVELSITPSAETLKGGGEVTLSVADNLPDGVKATVSCDDPEVKIAENEDGTYTVTLPDADATYTFTASYDGVKASCTVTVSAVEEQEPKPEDQKPAPESQKPQATPERGGALPQTGDPAGIIGALAAPGALLASVSAGALLRRRR